MLKEFLPILLDQYKDEGIMEYESFDRCIDEYFSQA